MSSTEDKQLHDDTITDEYAIVQLGEQMLFTKAQAAQMLNMSSSSIAWLLRKGTLPHRKIAGKIRFTRSDLEALIEASAVTQRCATEQKGA